MACAVEGAGEVGACVEVVTQGKLAMRASYTEAMRTYIRLTCYQKRHFL